MTMQLAAGPNIPDMVERLEANCDLWPRRTAIACGAERWSFSDLHGASDRLAANFAGLGLAGERVAVLCMTRPELPLVYYGAWKCGAAAVPINYSFKAGELATTLANCRPRALVVQRRLLRELRGAGGGLLGSIPHKFLIDPAPGGLPGGFEAFDRLLAPGGAAFHKAPGEPGVVFHTSGTTGKPKGAVHTLASASHFAWAYRSLCRGEPDPLTVVARNCYHSGGFFNLLGALSCGVTCVLADGGGPFDAAAYLDSLAVHRATQVFLNVAMLNAVLRWPGASLRHFERAAFVSAGADEVKPHHHEQLSRLTPLPLLTRYSSTEATSVAINDSPDEAGRRLSVGRPFGHFEWKLDGPAAGPGELLLRGPSLFRGYLNAPEATARAFADGGWYRTGDTFAADGTGRLMFRGRRGDAIKVSGRFVAPGEIEDAALAHPAVAEAVAVAAPHDVHVEVPYLFVRLKAGTGAGDLLGFLGRRIADYKVPVRAESVDRIPTAPSGKVDRRALAERAARALARR